MSDSVFKKHDSYMSATFLSENEIRKGIYWKGSDAKTIRMFFELLSYYCVDRDEINAYYSITSPATKNYRNWSIKELIPDFDAFESFLSDPKTFAKERPDFFEKTFGLEYMKPLKSLWSGNRSIWFEHGYGTFNRSIPFISWAKQLFFSSKRRIKGMEVNFNFSDIAFVHYSPTNFSFALNNSLFRFWSFKEGALVIESYRVEGIEPVAIENPKRNG